jgi:protein-tyrosine phosphatase
MAEEYQPRGHNFPGTTVVHAPILDNLWGVTLAEREMIDRTARLVARALRAGKTVLVTCNAGLNRSGVISALALRHVYKMPAEQAIALVRRARGPAALGNHHFIEIIKRS